MSTSGGSSGATGTLLIGKQTSVDPLGNPGLYALTSTVPVDGGWVDVQMGAANAALVVGAQTDTTFQGIVRGGVGGAGVGTYSDGAEVGYTDMSQSAGAATIGAHAETGQTTSLLELHAADDAQIFQVLGDKKIGVFAAAPVVQQANIPDAAGGAVIDVQARAAVNAALALLKSYGWMHT